MPHAWSKKWLNGRLLPAPIGPEAPWSRAGTEVGAVLGKEYGGPLRAPRFRNGGDTDHALENASNGAG